MYLLCPACIQFTPFFFFFSSVQFSSLFFGKKLNISHILIPLLYLLSSFIIHLSFIVPCLFVYLFTLFSPYLLLVRHYHLETHPSAFASLQKWQEGISSFDYIYIVYLITSFICFFHYSLYLFAYSVYRFILNVIYFSSMSFYLFSG